jgi:hypothetical protein
MISLVRNITNIHESPARTWGWRVLGSKNQLFGGNTNYMLVFFRKGQVKQVKWVSAADGTGVIWSCSYSDHLAGW